MSIKVYQILTILVFLLFQQVMQQTVQSSEDLLQLQKCPIYIASLQQTNISQQKSTLLTFYVQQKTLQQLQQQNFIQLQLSIKEKDNSLQKAITKAHKKVQLVKNVSKEYCYQNKGDFCQQIVQTDNFKVTPSYQTVKRQPIFNGFFVTYQVKILVYQTHIIGQLVDNLLRLGIHQIESIEWKSNVQINTVSKLIDAGISEARHLCKHINRTMGTVLSISQIYQPQQAMLTKQSDDEDSQKNTQLQSKQQPQEKQPPLFKFEVQCVGKIQSKILQSEKQTKSKKKKK